MNDQSYLMFKLNHLCYGIPATAVQELFFLPEMTPIAASPGILGMINLRGELLPILDVCHRLAQPRSAFQLTDNVIVLEWQTQRLGIVVSQVDGVQSIATHQLPASLYGQPEENFQNGLVIGMIDVENNIVTLLNPEPLVQQTVVQTVYPNAESQNGAMNGARKQSSNSVSNPVLNQGLYDHFDTQARQILRDRTATLRCPINSQDSTELLPLAVVGLGGEYFGFSLETVCEFTNIHKITPIPCCPPHIVGNINLRGEIVTLININDVIDLPMSAVRSRLQAVVVRLDQQMAGIAVDDVFDVTYIHPSQMTPAPIAMHSAKDDYLQGVAPYQNRMMSIINLSKLLTSDVLVVNEEV